MLQLFRKIQITGAFFLAAYVALLHAASFSGQVDPPEPMPDSGLLFNSLFSWAYGMPLVSAVAAAVLVYFQALIVNALVDQFRLMNDRNWFPGMGYALAASALPDFQFLSAPLVASTFVAISLLRILNTYKAPKSAVMVFDAAFWIAVASLFYPKALWLEIAAYLSVGIMRSWSGRDILVFVSGLFVPLFLGWLLYFWGDNGGGFRDRHLGDLFGWIQVDGQFNLSTVLKSAFTGLLLLLMVVNYPVFMRNKSMHGQKSISVFYLFLVTGSVTILLRSGIRWEVFALTAVPVGIFLAMWLHGMRRLFAEIAHILLIGMVFYLQLA